MIQVKEVSSIGPVTQLFILRAPLGLPPYHTAAYWVDGLLIDTGCAHAAQDLVASLEGLQIEWIVNTHSHEDHIGANAQIQDIVHCPVLAHPDALATLSNPRLEKLQLYRRLYWGRPAPSQARPIEEWLKTRRFRFQVIHTPGHSLDHICLFEPEQGWLFSGDAYIGGKDRALREGCDIAGILTSLKVLARLPVSTIFSGSGSVRTNGQEALLEKIAYLEQLGEQISGLYARGFSPRQIQRKLLGSDPFLTYLTLGHFSGRRLVLSYLEATGKSPAPVAAILRQTGTNAP